MLVAVLVAFYALRWLILRYSASGFALLTSLLRSIATAIRTNPEVERLVARFPRTFRFLGNRLDRSRWRGLPLTVTLVAGLYLLALFGGLAEDVLRQEAVVQVDHRISLFMAGLRTPFFNHLFYFITSLGYWQVTYQRGHRGQCLPVVPQAPDFIVPLLVSMASSQGLTYIGKYAFHRERPSHGMMDPTSFSFPSGHASVSVAFYGFVCYLGMRLSQRWKNRINLFVLGAVIVFLIGFSRLYLGVHYPE